MFIKIFLCWHFQNKLERKMMFLWRIPSLITRFGHSHTPIVICYRFESFQSNRWTFTKMKKELLLPPFSILPSKGCTWGKLSSDARWLNQSYLKSRRCSLEIIQEDGLGLMECHITNIQKISSLVWSHKTEYKLKSIPISK